MQTGELAALPGQSGSGKSTLMQPTSGSHTMLGIDLAVAGIRALTDYRNRHIGYVFQFHNLLPDFTTPENAIFPTAV